MAQLMNLQTNICFNFISMINNIFLQHCCLFVHYPVCPSKTGLDANNNKKNLYFFFYQDHSIMNQTINWRSKLFLKRNSKLKQVKIVLGFLFVDLQSYYFVLPAGWAVQQEICILHWGWWKAASLCVKMHLPLIPSLSFEPTDCVFQPIENWALYQIMFVAM